MARRRTKRNDHRVRRGGDRRIRLSAIHRDDDIDVSGSLTAKLLLAFVGYHLYKWWTTPAAPPKV